MQAIRAIFFDIGDTLVFDDPPRVERFRLAAGAAGLSFDPERLPPAFRRAEEFALERYLAGTPWDDPEILRACAELILAALDVSPVLDGCRWDCLRQAFEAIPFQRKVHPEAIPLLQALRRRGFRVGVISDWEETLPELLAELALAPHLDALAVSAVVGVTKPDPRLFAEALRQAEVPPDQSLHVGDWLELDVAGARAAGMTALLFDWPRRAPFADCPRVESFDALTGFLLALPPCIAL